MYTIVASPNFVRGIKRCVKKNWRLEAIEEALEAIENSDQEDSPVKYNLHALQGKYKGCREIHLEGRKSDWLLIYKLEGKSAKIIATGTHDELF